MNKSQLVVIFLVSLLVNVISLGVIFSFYLVEKSISPIYYISTDMNPPNYEIEINGYYLHDRYFCVLTENRSFEEIAETTFHELSHHYVYKDLEEFCHE